MSLRRFRMLLPPSSYLVLYVALYLLANLPVILAGGNAWAPVPERLLFPRRAILILGLIAYGGYRSLGFHPYFRAGYRAWLETTPWTWRKPLPVGPVRPVWEDAVIVAAMCAPAWFFGDLPVLGTYCIALGAYLFGLSLTFSQTGAWGFQYAVLFVVAAALRGWDQPAWAYTGAILLAAVLGLVGLGRSLKRWPWEMGAALDPNRIETAFNTPLATAAGRADLGWPFDRIGPRKDPPAKWSDHLDGFFQSALVGCWLFAILGLIPDPNGRAGMGTMVLIYVTIFALAFRVTRYLAGYAPPLNLSARLATFRWIVPSYDQVFIAPLAAMFASSVCPFLFCRAGLPVDGAMSISLALVLMAVGMGGPDRRTWQLTAKHRIVPAVSSTSKAKGGFVQVG
ncbi:MAG: hypothetical protein JWN86_503 [Planctomycetota bacterium]|nr:hypothetical protein [Planctomycetota bacterium]